MTEDSSVAGSRLCREFAVEVQAFFDNVADHVGDHIARGRDGVVVRVANSSPGILVASDPDALLSRDLASSPGSADSVRNVVQSASRSTDSHGLGTIGDELAIHDQ
jgi:hypothetical protein